MGSGDLGFDAFTIGNDAIKYCFLVFFMLEFTSQMTGMTQKWHLRRT
jgi:hypothetical protein